MHKDPTAIEVFDEADRNEPVEPHSLLIKSDLLKLDWRMHPLGFVHVELARLNEFAVRLHIWKSTSRYEQVPYWPIHNHKFDLISQLIIGRVTNHAYSLEESFIPTGQCLYAVEYENGASVLERTSTNVKVALETSKTLSAPDMYRVSAGAFHETEVKQGTFAATLAFTRDSLDSFVIRTVGDDLLESRFVYRRAAISLEEKQELLNTLMDSIS